jgi:hypothetical protein
MPLVPAARSSAKTRVDLFASLNCTLSHDFAPMTQPLNLLSQRRAAVQPHRREETPLAGLARKLDMDALMALPPVIQPIKLRCDVSRCSTLVTPHTPLAALLGSEGQGLWLKASLAGTVSRARGPQHLPLAPLQLLHASRCLGAVY